MVKTLKINQRTISRIQAKMSWKGKGTKDDPIIINAIHDQNLALKIKNMENYILIKNITIAEVRLVKCRNIIIRDCNIYHLWLIASQSVSVMNTAIVHGNLTYSRGNYFKDNLFGKDSAFHTLKSKKGDNTANVMQVIFALPILIFTIPLIIMLLHSQFDLLIFPIVIVTFPLLPIIDLRIKKHKTKKLPANLFENNQADELEELSQIYKDFRI